MKEQPESRMPLDAVLRNRSLVSDEVVDAFHLLTGLRRKTIGLFIPFKSHGFPGKYA
jgi:hypothetical protein